MYLAYLAAIRGYQGPSAVCELGFPGAAPPAGRPVEHRHSGHMKSMCRGTCWLDPSPSTRSDRATPLPSGCASARSREASQDVRRVESCEMSKSSLTPTTAKVKRPHIVRLTV